MKPTSFPLMLLVAILLASGCATAVMSGAGRSGDARDDDSRITRNVRTLIYRDDLLADARIRVSTNDGAVTLRGEVGSIAARDRALAIANRVAGVRSVNVELRVNDTR